MSENKERDKSLEEEEEYRVSRGAAIAISVAVGTPILASALPLLIRH